MNQSENAANAPKMSQVGENKKTASPAKIQSQFRGIVVKYGFSVLFGLSTSPKPEDIST